MGWCGKDRFVEHVFPIAGKFLLGDNARRNGTMSAAKCADHYPLADRSCRRITDVQRGHIEFGQGLNEAEAAFLVVAENVTWHGAAIVERDPQAFGFSD